MNKCIKNTHKWIFVVAENLHCDFARNTEDSFDASYSKTINKVLRESERNSFGCLERFSLSVHVSQNNRGEVSAEYLLEETIEVYVD